MLLTPSPLSQTVTPSRTPSPSSVTYFMDSPLARHFWHAGHSLGTPELDSDWQTRGAV